MRYVEYFSQNWSLKRPRDSSRASPGLVEFPYNNKPKRRRHERKTPTRKDYKHRRGAGEEPAWRSSTGNRRIDVEQVVWILLVIQLQSTLVMQNLH